MTTISGLFDNKGTPLEKQQFTWKEIGGIKPISKLDDDAFTRVRIILMNGIEVDALRLKHIGARFHRDLRVPLAKIRRVEQHQNTMINWLLSPDHSPLETTIAYEQTAIEITAAVAQTEPDAYQAQAYRFGLLEDFDHLYRYAALLDRLEGKDANNILQCYTDILPGRPTWLEHRAPEDDVRNSYNRKDAALITKLHAALITAAEYQTHDYYMNIGPLFADPVARQIYAEIASMEEQHVTQYGSLIDPEETFIEKWLIHEAMEVYTYYSCAQQETNPRIKAIWERFLDYELGHLNYVKEIMKKYERRDPAEILSGTIPSFVTFASQRDYVREVLTNEVDLRANKTEYVPREEESQDSINYKNYMNSEGNSSLTASIGYKWMPGTELNNKAKGE
ncbi:MAG: Ferritin-like protein [Burkholderiales bacterium]|jgi:rubrerythrin|nr:Ferritin-like protein [Burkholderiales bacterium]